MKTGEVIKHIRTSKSLKSKDVYNDILSRPVISKFENGISDTTTTKFFQILQNLNVTLDEFYHIYNDFSENTDSKFLADYTKAFYSTNRGILKKLYDDVKKKYELTHQTKYLHYAILVELTLEDPKNNINSDKSLEILKRYLLNCEDWTYYEIVLFTNLLDYFSLEVINIFYKRVKKKLAYYNKTKKYRNELFSLITNILVLHIEDNNIASCKFFYSELVACSSQTSNLMYEKTMILFFKELLILMEKSTYDPDNVNRIVDIFDFLGMEFKKKQCIELIQLVIENNG